MDYSKTSIFNVQELRQELILMMLNEVIEALELKVIMLPINWWVIY